jgi:putative two-component system response regulator
MPETTLQQGKILIVDDELANVRFLEIILHEAGYHNIYSTTDARQALSLFQSIKPDLLLLDLSMPYLDGFAVMKQVHDDADPNVPILVLTADSTVATRHRALSEGAKDFLAKPLDAVEVLLRLRNLLEGRFQHVLLEQKVWERTKDLEKAQLETLQRLALAAEYRDDDTGTHTKRVGHTARHLSLALGWTPERADLLARAAPLHDVGKIGVPDSILLKPAKLTDEEFATMKRHTVIGAGILSGSSSPWLHLAEEIALSHHERWDGGGYPAHLAGDSIPISGRIVALADVFDALTHERPYKKAWTIADAVAEIDSQSGRQFDPDVIAAFRTLHHEDFI